MFRKSRKYFACLICVLYVSVILFSGLFILRAYGHDCTGESCPVCACVEQAEQALNQLGGGAICAAAAVLIVVAALQITVPVCPFISCTSPVNSKVRLNN